MTIPVDEIINNLSRKQKTAFVLVIGEMILNEIKVDAKASLLAREALDLCWDWVKGKDVDGDAIAEYVDSPSEKDLGVRAAYFGENQPMISAVASITLAIGLVARYAYECKDVKSMPTPIWETDDDSIYEVVEFATQSKFFDFKKVESVCEFLIKSNASQWAEGSVAELIRDVRSM